MGRSAPESYYTNNVLPRTNRTILAFVLPEDGQDEEATQLFDEPLAGAEASIADNDSYYLRFMDVAAIYAYRGVPDQALAALEQAFETGFMADYMLRPDPMFQSLQN